MRVSSTACNEPSIDGYVAALLGSRVAGLRACHAGHRADDDIKMARFYRDMDVEGGDALWMYMPVDSDEYIMEIRVVRSQVSRTRGLMVRQDCILRCGTELMLSYSLSPTKTEPPFLVKWSPDASQPAFRCTIYPSPRPMSFLYRP
jgi:hypothetical protein